MVNGGHIPPLIILEDGTVTTSLDGDVPVGLFPEASFHALSFKLPPKARLVLLSDGVTEAEDPEGNQFGTQSSSE